MNSSATAIKKFTAHLFAQLSLHLFKKYLFDGCYVSGTKENKTAEAFHQSLHSSFSHLKFGNYRPRLDLAITADTLQSRDQRFFSS